MSDLVASLELFARKLFGKDTRIRIRPHHFPFTEPSCEVDISCWTCDGNDLNCKTCHGEGFIEILGGGMVHPEVLENCNIDSKNIPALLSVLVWNVSQWADMMLLIFETSMKTICVF